MFLWDVLDIYIYSEKAIKFCKIFTLLLFYVVPVKSKAKISQNFVTFSKYMNFIFRPWKRIEVLQLKFCNWRCSIEYWCHRWCCFGAQWYTYSATHTQHIGQFFFKNLSRNLSFSKIPGHCSQEFIRQQEILYKYSGDWM